MVDTTYAPAHPRLQHWAPRFLLLAIAAAALSSSTTPPELTAAQAAKCPGQYVHVRAIVATTRSTGGGYTFISLDKPGRACPLEVAVRPELLLNFIRHLGHHPNQLTGHTVTVQGYVQATSSTAQIWLDRAPALSEAAP